MWNLYWILLPHRQLLAPVLGVGQPRVETSCACEAIFAPQGWHFVEIDIVHDLLHVFGHCQFTLECEFDVSK